MTMDQTSRIIGKLEEFKNSTDKRLDTLEKKIDDIQKWRWKQIGGHGIFMAAVSAFVHWVLSGGSKG